MLRLACLAPLAILIPAAGTAEQARPADDALAALGAQLFVDPALSRNATQSCATCHDPARAFTDPREGKAGLAVSVGDDGQSHGDRNTPTLGYAALVPAFHRDANGKYKGGQFWDGRADDLKQQAGQPMLNPVEMAMPDRAAVAARLRDDPAYRTGFEALFGKGVLDDPERAFDAAAEALAAYQATGEFSPFDSKYDRVMRGEEKFTPLEEFGYTVFITWNCRLCHMQRKQGVAERETFTNFEYHNIGLPVNETAREASGLGADHVDHGLLARPGIEDPAQSGRFKVPSLRNVAVTGPYMHNGVFTDLRTAILFYNKYTSRRPEAKINPETGAPWGEPEVARNLSLAELQSGLMLDDGRVDALVAFLETLTDRRYEPLLEESRAAQKD
ncbi:methylamine utilization protein MauG [Paracoccus denitrificans]|jgi:cytochrome c peroxidase|uniref:Methylamine utilization protein MauG n=1 Tax=Paracoccus denitrificans (strain Pd 1222) TaxID=318586 RepID=MAUG_PARDP|nr:methylamine utilization protein MauG [Paracoccus denitrificans]Q51658.1 RecName: Full=Methylamine utilization protein MauG; Flags: Precursor [Paracoccus denitrificans PD1222]AAA86467.1 MauG [Paracoccus denitrificans PD1222]ABL72797.1 Di-heme cytochrome c peroxidase [Paracoccus denitrificans PD1222]MBB4626276.1 cytochrome c peroxidase [Paracoccus denitrificans]MCU7427519.1 methylamine utilization protein MauG [Paracoccus denitrificans]QAR29757.1 methylamine utilization protein MauG [Paracoc